MQAAEVLALAGIVVALFWVLTPIRRRLEAAIRRRLPAARPGRRGKVIPLVRKDDGTFEREEGGR